MPKAFWGRERAPVAGPFPPIQHFFGPNLRLMFVELAVGGVSRQ